MKILFTCPILDIRYEWFDGFINILEQLRKYEYELFIPYRKPVQVADNMMAKKAMEGNFDYVLRMDDDVWDVPHNCLEELIKADKDYISAVMYASVFPYRRCVLNKDNKNDSLIDIAKNNTGGLREVGGSGVTAVDMTAFPFTLIKTSVFRRIDPPWFVSDEKVPSDSYFCQKLHDNGIQPYAHLDMQVTHRGVSYWNRTHLMIAEGEQGILQGRLDYKFIGTFSKELEKFKEKYNNKKKEDLICLRK